MTDTVSVVLPTRNRRVEALSTIATVLASTHEDLVLHVFDNNSTDGTRDAVLALEDDRIDYQRSDTDLSLADSFEAAYSRARADWVTGLGADDGFSKFCIEGLLHLARSERLQVATSIHASYHWPGMSDDDEGLLSVRHVKPDRVVGSRGVMLEVLLGMTSFQALLTAYKYGVARRQVLDTLRHRNGRLFNSWNPGVFLGFAVAGLVPFFAVSGRPLTISGTSPDSTGRNTLGSGVRPGPAEEYFRLSQDSRVEIHPSIARVDGTLPRSLQVMTLEAYLQASSAQDRVERLVTAPIVQSAVILGGHRTVSDEVKVWLREYVVSGYRPPLGRARWVIARLSSKMVQGAYRVWNRLKRHGIPSGLVPVEKASLAEHASLVVRARSAYGIHLSPAPRTLDAAVLLLDAALAEDARRT